MKRSRLLGSVAKEFFVRRHAAPFTVHQRVFFKYAYASKRKPLEEPAAAFIGNETSSDAFVETVRGGMAQQRAKQLGSNAAPPSGSCDII